MDGWDQIGWKSCLLRAPLCSADLKDDKYDNNNNDKKRDDADDDRVVWFSNEAVIGRRPAVNKERQSRQNLLLNVINVVRLIIMRIVLTLMLCR